MYLSDYSKSSWKHINIWYLIIPLSFLFFIFIVPLLDMLYMSFFKFNGVGNPLGEFTLVNYAKFLSSAYYWQILGVSILLGLVSTIICVIVGYPVAYKISKMRGNLRHFVNTLTLLTLWVAITVRMFGWMNLLSVNGVISNVIASFTGEKYAMLGTYIGVEIGLVYCGLPYFIMIMTGALENLDHSLEEASYVFGAGFFKTIFNVVIPETKEAIFSGAVLVFALNTAAFVVPVILGSGKITVMTNLIYNRATYSYDWGFAAALSVIFLVFSIVIMNLNKMLCLKRAGDQHA